MKKYSKLLFVSVIVMFGVIFLVESGMADVREQQMVWYRTGQHYMQAKQNFDLKNYEQAATYYELAVATADSLTNPNDGQKKFQIQARQELAKCHEELGNYEKAVKYYTDAADRNPKPEFYHNVVIVYQKAKNSTKMIELANKILEMDENFVKAYTAIGDAYRIDKKYKEALDQYNLAIEKGDEKAMERIEAMGADLHNKKQWRQSEMVQKYILEKNPDDVAAHAKLGASYAERDYFDEAYEHFQIVKDDKGKWGKFARQWIKQIDKIRNAE